MAVSVLWVAAVACFTVPLWPEAESMSACQLEQAEPSGARDLGSA